MHNTNQTATDMPSETTKARNPDYSEIAALAYELWNSRGCPMGSSDVDWFQAESELRSRETRDQIAAAVA